MSKGKVLEIARLELGVCEEPPGSNRTKYGAAYGLDRKYIGRIADLPDPEPEPEEEDENE